MNRTHTLDLPETTIPGGGDVVGRHRISTRLWHWTNIVTLVIMLLIGLMIVNAHPRPYWGKYGANADYAWLRIGAQDDKGHLRVGTLTVTNTGVLGRWTDQGGQIRNCASPSWSTLLRSYNLALTRQGHLTFAWVFSLGLTAYLARGLWHRHVQRGLLPTLEKLRPAHIWADIKHHAHLQFSTGEAARGYNILQRFAYLSVLILLIPGKILTGMSMSPNPNVSFYWLLDLFGGRQPARTLHFLFATGLALIIIVHLLQVILAGPLNEVRSMITGRYGVPKDKPKCHPRSPVVAC